MIELKVKSVVIPEFGTLTVTGIYDKSKPWFDGRSSHLIFSATVSNLRKTISQPNKTEVKSVLSVVAEVSNKKKYPKWYLDEYESNSCNWTETLWQLFYNKRVMKPLYEHDTVMMLLTFPESMDIKTKILGSHLRDVIKMMFEIQHEFMPNRKAEFFAYLGNLDDGSYQKALFATFLNAKCAVFHCSNPFVGEDYDGTFLCMHRYSTFFNLQEEEKDASCDKNAKISPDVEDDNIHWPVYQSRSVDFKPIPEWDDDDIYDE